jgi:hypothetical protein
MRTPSPSYCRLDLAPPLADRFIFGVAPIDYGPVLLLMPFGFHLAMDTLASGNCEDWLQVCLGCFRLSPSCPFRLLHTCSSSRPARHYPRVRIQRSSSERRRGLNPPDQRAAQRYNMGLSDSPPGRTMVMYSHGPLVAQAPTRQGLPGSSADLSTRAVPNHPGRSDGCLRLLLHHRSCLASS